MELLKEEEEDFTKVNEAANFQTSAYDSLSADLLDSSIIFLLTWGEIIFILLHSYHWQFIFLR